MAFTPQSVPVYLKAFAGSLAGLAAAGKYLTDINAGDYFGYSQMADAFAQEVDVQWAAVAHVTPTGLDLDSIAELAEAIWENRSPINLPNALLAGNYYAAARGLVACVLEGNARVVAQGINPNAASMTVESTFTTMPSQAAINFLMTAATNNPAKGSVDISIGTRYIQTVAISDQFINNLGVDPGAIRLFVTMQSPSTWTLVTPDPSTLITGTNLAIIPSGLGGPGLSAIIALDMLGSTPGQTLGIVDQNGGGTLVTLVATSGQPGWAEFVWLQTYDVGFGPAPDQHWHLLRQGNNP